MRPCSGYTLIGADIFMDCYSIGYGQAFNLSSPLKEGVTIRKIVTSSLRGLNKFKYTRLAAAVTLSVPISRRAARLIRVVRLNILISRKPYKRYRA